MANELTKRVMQRIVERSGRSYEPVESSGKSCMPQAGNVHLTEREVGHLSGLLHKQSSSNTSGPRHETQGGSFAKQPHAEKPVVSVTLPSGGGRLKLDDLVRQVRK